MPRKSLRPHLNQIRAWVRQGRTDAWVAHQLEVSVRDIEQFKRQNDLAGEEAADVATSGDFPEEIDLRAEDDALIAAELEAAEAEAERALAEAATGADDDEEEDGEGTGTRTRRRSRRGGRRTRGSARNTGPLEGTFDHGEEGFGLWLDPAIQDNPIYAEHWAGHRPVEVAVEEDRIVIRRTDADED
jgi:NACalpha-BTF3-like transcription factor